MQASHRIHEDPASNAYAHFPARPPLHSYPPSYSSHPSFAHEPSPPSPPLPRDDPPATTTEPLLKRLSLRLTAQDPNYKTPEQLAEEDRSLDAEEEAMLKRGMINWREMRRWQFWIRKEWWGEFD